mmetsp:Transcript_22778/g.44753  ORF Transcript_22778/g.44753 Transcript_22778/m.44753 type:complete len:206 (-) Transcript_22778:576-1193(-)|eukprot:CAMPEP_0171526712 /NCGR_PEP_ID=MMETSP0959-20130129/10575_1 /TAXON_ID=87120 /ORGANISM="Aurantiochytrium limacinum, Strain ATCCMYA-1381" /LENGTH=205 /DNA_ID=CAMNT_0012068225 /DNA_START=195 /DNA_END=812 /DNA_ORIENTATION=-
MATAETWVDTAVEVLDHHQVRDDVAQVLLWENPLQSTTYLLAGIGIFVLTEVFNVGIMIVMGSTLILQLLVYRFAAFLQDRDIAFENVDLREKIVLTPEPSAVSTTVEIVGDLLRIVEESIKDLSLTSDYFRLAQGFSFLLFLSAVGRVLPLSVVLLICWVGAFILPMIYVHNQEFFDGLMQRSSEVVRMMLGMGGRRKRRSKEY